LNTTSCIAEALDFRHPPAFAHAAGATRAFAIWLIADRIVGWSAHEDRAAVKRKKSRLVSRYLKIGKNVVEAMKSPDVALQGIEGTMEP
jgi:hypothetical protein